MLSLRTPHCKAVRRLALPLSHARHTRVACLSSGAAPVAAPVFLLKYRYVEGMLDKREPHRAAHLKHAAEFIGRGEILLGGALADPVDEGLIVFKGSVGLAGVERFAKVDPYVTSQLVEEWSVRQWNIVVGNDRVE